MFTRSLLLMLLLTSSICNAQTAYTITGKVIDAEGKPIVTATILVQRGIDSTIIGMEHTNADGQYIVSLKDTNTVLITAQAIGYTSVTQKADQNIFNQPLNFVLKANKTLSEVTVTSRKPRVEYKIDRTVFNVENSIVATGGDAWDALKKTPGILILRNQVTIAGRSSVGVMINGKLQQLSGEDLAQLLRSIPSDNLSKIEVITSPPAKYDAEGNGGLVNIITKKSLKQGLKGNVTASFNRNTYNSPVFSTSLNYRTNKLNLFCNANAGIYAWKYTARATTYYPGQRWEQRVHQASFNKNARVLLGAEYNLSTHSTIGLQLSEAMNKIDNTEDITAMSLNDENVADSGNRTQGETHELYPGKHTINLNYEWRIDSSGKKLNVDLDYYEQTCERTRDFDVTSYTEAPVTNRMTADPSIKIRSVKADLEWPLKFARFTVGTKISAVDNAANNVFLTKNGDGYITDNTKTNAFSYTEEIQALYITGQKKIGKLELQLGMRAEHTETEGYSSTIVKTNVNDYIKYFPSGFAQYSLSDKHVFSLNAARRINRPGYSSLNPFRFYYSPTSFREGNPNLQPSFNTKLEVGYTYASKYNIRVFGNRVKNYWDRIFVTDTVAGTSNITWLNMGDNFYLGITLSGNFNPTDWWECTIGLNGAHTIFNPYNNLSTRYTGINAGIEAGSSFFLNSKKTLAFELNGYYNTPKQKDYKRWEMMACINVGIRWMLLDKDLILALNGDDLTAGAYWLQTNLANGTREYTYDDERSVHFSVTYKFGNKNIKSKRDKNTLEEIQRANQ